MPKRFIVPILLAAITLSACGGAPEPATPSAAQTATSKTTQGDSGMFKECQGATLHLTGLAKEGDAPMRTRLELERNGQRREIEAPAELQDYSAAGLACVQDVDGTPYFVVEYGEQPYGCSFCEWFHVIDADGHRLTNSKPPMLEDKSLPEGNQQTANNQEYEATIKRLGIAHPEIDYFDPGA